MTIESTHIHTHARARTRVRQSLQSLKRGKKFQLHAPLQTMKKKPANAQNDPRTRMVVQGQLVAGRFL